MLSGWRACLLALLLGGSCKGAITLGKECQRYAEEVRRLCEATQERPGTREVCSELGALLASWKEGIKHPRTPEEIANLEERCKEALEGITALNRAGVR